MVGNHAHSYVNLLLFAIFATANLANLLEHGLEHIGIVVGLLTLNGAYETLEAHARINHFLCKRLKRTIGFAVELHEHNVPNLNHLWMVFIHEFATGELCFLCFRTAVNMDLGAGATRTGIAHLPEVIVFVTIEDMVCGQMSAPDGCSFVIATQALFRRAFEHRHVEVSWVDFQHINDIFPCKIDGAFLEVIAKRPVAEHLEHGVVIRIMSHFFQIVVFARHAQAFLRVGYTRIFDGVIAQNNALPRVHTGIGEHEGRVVFDNHRGGWHYLVAFTCHKVQKGLANFLTCHHYC